MAPLLAWKSGVTLKDLNKLKITLQRQKEKFIIELEYNRIKYESIVCKICCQNRPTDQYVCICLIFVIILWKIS